MVSDLGAMDLERFRPVQPFSQLILCAMHRFCTDLLPSLKMEAAYALDVPSHIGVRLRWCLKSSLAFVYCGMRCLSIVVCMFPMYRFPDDVLQDKGIWCCSAVITAAVSILCIFMFNSCKSGEVWSSAATLSAM